MLAASAGVHSPVATAPPYRTVSWIAQFRITKPFADTFPWSRGCSTFRWRSTEAAAAHGRRRIRWGGCAACETSADEGVCWVSPRQRRDVVLFTFFADPQLSADGGLVPIGRNWQRQPHCPTYRWCYPICWLLNLFDRKERDRFECGFASATIGESI
jgi:hypothetical protein